MPKSLSRQLDDAITAENRYWLEHPDELSEWSERQARASWGLLCLRFWGPLFGFEWGYDATTGRAGQLFPLPEIAE